MEKAVEKGKAHYARSYPSVTAMSYHLIEFLGEEHAEECLKETPNGYHDQKAKGA